MGSIQPLTYFTCTLGEAVSLRKDNPPPWKTIPELLKWQAEHKGDDIAVGLPIAPQPGGGQWNTQVYTFAGLFAKVQAHAHTLSQYIIPGEPVGLLCSSGSDFLFSWLGLVYLGVPVLLIATEVTIAGTAGLLEKVGAKMLFHDEKCAQNARKAIEVLVGTARQGYKALPLALPSDPDSLPRIGLPRNIDASSVAYFHHTSGTSSGIPSAISTTHFGAAGALPVLENTGPTFTTTPLFHGGPADCFRSWTSGAAIWLFPGIGDVPIIPRHVIDAFNVAQGSNEEDQISYFSAVPYVLEALSASKEGLKILQNVDLVGTGGAALSDKLGDRLAKGEQVSLISRYGSAECGFILSSRRDFFISEDWQWLRLYQNPYMTFKRQPAPLVNVFELELKDWPFMAKADANGIYNTGDCFEQHPTKTHLYRYHSRSDAQIALSTGLKFDPNFIEARLLDAVRDLGAVRELYVFGKGKDYPGLFVFRHQKSDLKDAEINDQLWRVLEILNDELPPHAKIRRNMIVVLSANEPPLDRSSKGTLLRGRIDEALQAQISQAYQRPSGQFGQRKPLDVQKLAFDVKAIVKEVAFPVTIAPSTISNTADLYGMGINSQYAMAIREHLQIRYAQVLDIELPPMWVYECGSIDGMIKHIIALYQGEGLARDNDFERMQAMRQTYGHMYMPEGKSHPEPSPKRTKYINGDQSQDAESIILTGVTGTLGIHILDQLRASDKIREIHCLIRGASQTAAEERVRKALSQKHLAPLETSKAAVHIHTCNLVEERLGLTEEVSKFLAQNATLIIHVAWQVNFSLPLKGFEDQLKSLQNLLSFALHSERHISPSFIFCSSTANVLGPTRPQSIQERVYEDPSISSEIGYARSKWVAESVCESVHKEYGLPIVVARIGQLCGDETTGTWNVTEAWPLMLSSSRVTGSLPQLKETLNWLKVDIAASAVIELSHDFLDQSRSESDTETSLPVYHVINSHKTPTWDDMLGWIQKQKPDLEVLSPSTWVKKLEGLEGEARQHPARKLLGLWTTAYGKADSKNLEAKAKEPTFELEKTLKAAPVLREVRPLDEEYFAKVWAWVEKEM